MALVNTIADEIVESQVEAAALAHIAIHETTEAILSAMPRGRLLDVPAGEGALAARLLKLGFDVHCCDLYPEIFKLSGVEIKRGDMSESLPYPDLAFDVVTCVEGLEHIENPQRAIREFRRVLKPGGSLIVSVPNILNIEERLKWLFSGYTSHFKPISKESLQQIQSEFGSMEEIALHINPVGYAELRYSLEKFGFEVVKLYRDRKKAMLWLYSPLVLLIRLINRLTSERKRRERWLDELHSDEVLMGGNTLIVHARLS
jgi:ubiquinone/menaquinone biosynthesis C-methylase UbiE